MEKFTSLTGVTAPLEIVNVDTDMIIPKQYLKTIKRTGLGSGLFAELRYREDSSENPDFVLNKPAYRNAKILVALDRAEPAGAPGIGAPCACFRNDRYYLLAGGTKSGYTFSFTAGTSNQSYSITATPITVGVTGQNMYYTDQSGVIRVDTSGASASATSTPIG